MVMVGRYGLMGQGMKDNGSLTKQMVKEHSGMFTGINMKEIGSMIKLKVKAFIRMLMEPNTQAFGKMIYNMVTVLKNGLMVADMKETMLQEESMERENTDGLMEVVI